MARKSTAHVKSTAVSPAAPKLRGRPPLKPRTTLARWIQDRNRTVTDFAAELRELAPKVGLSEDDCPQTKTLTDAVNARHWPHPKTILLVRMATDGAVDLEHWVRDLT
jgi:hypothetical protein